MELLPTLVSNLNIHKCSMILIAYNKSNKPLTLIAMLLISG